MNIIAGEKTISVKTIFSENRFHEGQTYPALRVVFEGGVSDDELDALTQNDWRLMGEHDEELSVQEGFTTIETHEVIFLKIGAMEIENQKLKEEIAEVSMVVPSLLKGKQDDTLVALLKYIPEWEQGKYAVGDVRQYESQPKICAQAHDSTGNEMWDPTVASLWSPYHAKSAEYALPWIKPTGAQDIYKANEYMVWTDGKTYRCKSDTAYSPTEYAQAWQLIS